MPMPQVGRAPAGHEELQMLLAVLLAVAGSTFGILFQNHKEGDLYIEGISGGV